MSTWPQWVFLFFWAMGIGITIAKFGKPKADFYDGADLLGAALAIWLLWMGGFFAPLGW